MAGFVGVPLLALSCWFHFHIKVRFAGAFFSHRQRAPTKLTHKEAPIRPIY